MGGRGGMAGVGGEWECGVTIGGGGGGGRYFPKFVVMLAVLSYSLAGLLFSIR